MYKTILHYQSEKIGVYSTEVTVIGNYIKHDGVINNVMTSYQVTDMFNRWSHRLCRHIDLGEYSMELSRFCQPQYVKDEKSDNFNLKLKLIQSHLNDLNEMNKEKIQSGEECERTFNITVEEII